MDITPLIMSFLLYGVPVFTVIWFMISVVNALRERNYLLKQLIKKLEKTKKYRIIKTTAVVHNYFDNKLEW
ncbi:hypothetical protein UACE39S_01094 [Ureibacillus acetophenoni]